MKDDAASDVRASRYGFEWGAVKVERFAEHKGHRILGITTPKEVLTIRVTPTGLIRVEETRKRKATKLERKP